MGNHGNVFKMEESLSRELHEYMKRIIGEDGEHLFVCADTLDLNKVFIPYTFEKVEDSIPITLSKLNEVHLDFRQMKCRNESSKNSEFGAKYFSPFDKINSEGKYNTADRHLKKLLNFLEFNFIDNAVISAAQLNFCDVDALWVKVSLQPRNIVFTEGLKDNNSKEFDKISESMKSKIEVLCRDTDLIAERTLITKIIQLPDEKIKVRILLMVKRNKRTKKFETEEIEKAIRDESKMEADDIHFNIDVASLLKKLLPGDSEMKKKMVIICHLIGLLMDNPDIRIDRSADNENAPRMPGTVDFLQPCLC